jgi:hypothetical protein
MNSVRAFVVALALAVGSGVATSAPAQADPWDGSGCTRLWAISTQYADVCKAWAAMGGGYYNGYVKITYHTPLAHTEVNLDGTIQPVSGTVAYTHFKKVLVRACYQPLGSGARCSGWW